jgi:hypothetical protein
MRLCLADFVDSDRKFEVDESLITSVHSSLCSVADDPSGNMQGYCSERTIGLFKRSRCVVFVYMAENLLKLALLGNVYNLSDENVTARVNFIFPLAKRFTLLRAEKVILSFNYWFFESRDYWPECDIFPFIERITSDPESKRRIVLILNELAEGGNITKSEFFARLEKVNS